MKTKYKYIEFNFIKDVWLITNHKRKEHIGQLVWNKRWKEWEFYPYEDTGWTLICLEDLTHFIKQLGAPK
jgi:hypothetical protein